MLRSVTLSPRITMRVITGSHKGRRLATPPGRLVRPTSERAREALFSILGPRVHKANLLDLYAGTGAVGLEAISRGARRVVFVDHQRASLKVLRDNLRRCGSPREGIVIPGDALHLARNAEFLRWTPFDIVFADPPYHVDIIEPLLALMSQETILSSEGILIFEHRTKTLVPQQTEGLRQMRQARYGDTVLSFFEKLSV